ncbi:MAG TPA: hypothetical protein VGB98_01975 [Pyrinomonadaceae bacterium]
MNCQEFESRVETLARGALADARTVAEAAAHEDACAACAVRLADLRALSTGLRALASGMKSAEAPARVEAALLTAFRARAASEVAEDLSHAGGDSNVVVQMPERVHVRQWSWARTAAVASLAAAASLALFVLVRPGAGVNQRAMIEPPPGALKARPDSEVARGATTTAEENSPLEVEAGSPSEIEGGATHAPSPSRDRSPRVTYTTAATAPTVAMPRVRAMNASYGGARPARPSADARAQEIATEFIPLMQGAPYQPAEGAHLVRLELPRSALASFGLPVGAESPGGRVKADVILGDDGIARAIRFVR